MKMVPWTSVEEAILVSDYLLKSRSAIEALLPTRTWRAIRAKATSLGLLLRGKKTPSWSESEMHLLQELRHRYTVKELQAFLPGRSLNAIWLRAERNSIGNGLYWSVDEINVLRQYYPTGDKETLLTLLPKRKWLSITQKARKEGIPGLGVSEIQRRRMTELNHDVGFNRKRLKALCKKPTVPELRVLSIIEHNHLPYKYVGDGSFLIERLNPDFININGDKTIIEVFGRVWHETLLRDWQRSELGRIMVFNAYGYRTLILWDDELMDESAILAKIRSFEGSYRRLRQAEVKKKLAEKVTKI